MSIALDQLARDVLHAIPAHVAVLDARGVILDVNERWRHFSLCNGGDPCGWVGRNYINTTQAAGDDPDAQAILAGIAAILSGGLRNFEHEYPCHDEQHFRWFRCLISPLYAPDGQNLNGLLVMHVDVSETKLALRAAETARTAMAEFVAIISHEIRSPLNAMLGAAQLLAHGSVEERRAEFLDLILRSGDSLQKLVEDILDISRGNVGMLHIHPVSTDLTALCREVIESLRLSAEQKGLSLSLFCRPAPLGPVLVDPFRLRQILLNLVGNAIKFTDQGTVSLNMAAYPSDIQDLDVTFTIQDHGVGLPEQKLEDLFEPFVQGDRGFSRRYGGAGLGLAICRKLVTAMQGQITAYNHPEGGAVFEVSLPLFLAEDHAQTDSHKTIMLHQKRSLRVLLVEDEEANRIVGRAMLEMMGHVVDIAADGWQAMTQVMAEPYDVVLLDMQLPGLDGLTVARLLRLLPHFADLPLIAMTANASLEDTVRQSHSGINETLAKPVLRHRLEKVMSCYAGQSQRKHVEMIQRDRLARIALDIGAERTGQVIEKTIQTLQGCLDDLRLAESSEIMRRSLHKIKGCAAMVGLSTLHLVATQAESAWTTGHEGGLQNELVLLCRLLLPISIEHLQGWTMSFTQVRTLQ